MASLSLLAFSFHVIDLVAWMILLARGLYLAYTPYNGFIFERLAAATGKAGIRRLLHLHADSAGAGAGSVVLLLVKNFSGLRLPWAQFLIGASIFSAVLGLALLAYAARFFLVKLGGR